MSAPSNLVSLRITDEEISLLDSRVGLDGMRNRSDVIRTAIREFLHGQPLLPDMKHVKVTIGRSTSLRLAKLYELHGITPEQAAQQGLQDLIKKMIEEENHLNNILDTELENIQAQTTAREEYRQ